MSKVIRTSVKDSLLKMMKSTPADEILKAGEEIGAKTSSYSDAVAAALLGRAVKGDIPAIKQLEELLKADGEEKKKDVSALYRALTKQNEQKK